MQGLSPQGTVPKTGGTVASITSMNEATQQPLQHQLEEIGTQLAWVRDYL
jgi:hypothetical protein